MAAGLLPLHMQGCASKPFWLSTAMEPDGGIADSSRLVLYKCTESPSAQRSARHTRRVGIITARAYEHAQRAC